MQMFWSVTSNKYLISHALKRAEIFSILNDIQSCFINSVSVILLDSDVKFCPCCLVMLFFLLCSNSLIELDLSNNDQDLGVKLLSDEMKSSHYLITMNHITPSTLILNTVAPQGCVLSPLLYSLYTHDCTAKHSSNVIVKFADDTTLYYIS